MAVLHGQNQARINPWSVGFANSGDPRRGICRQRASAAALTRGMVPRRPIPSERVGLEAAY